MKASASSLWSALPAAALLLSSTGSTFATFITRSIGGDATAASIQATVDLFRADIGSPNNGNAAGPLFGGRREINWDGGGSATTTSGSPFFGFQNIRGAAFSTPGVGNSFLQAPAAGLALQLAQPVYATEFAPFSAQRLFTPVGSNITDVTFSVPGSNGAIGATVGGFGAVFSDVDLPGFTRLQFFDLAGAEIFNQTVAPSAVRTAGLSFLGASGDAGEKIFRVRITSGNVGLGGLDSPTSDPVVMDDFFFREPTPIPEPTTVLFSLGLLGVCLGGRRRRA